MKIKNHVTFIEISENINFVVSFDIITRENKLNHKKIKKQKTLVNF